MKKLVFPRIFLHCAALDSIVSGLLLRVSCEFDSRQGCQNCRCKPFLAGLQRFFVIVFPEHSCYSVGTIIYSFRCMPANWLRTIFPALLIKNADLLIRFSHPIFRMEPTPIMWPVYWPVPATYKVVPLLHGLLASM